MNNPNDVFKHLSVSEISDFENIELIPINGEGIGSDDKMGVLSDELPILPIRNIVLFPGMVIPITVSRQKSVRLVKRRIREIGPSEFWYKPVIQKKNPRSMICIK